ncbi:uncharacterized protein LOC124910419 [Impatiens glandulifera]|uniref:uncharacterized protein LOC124910419 n=1 Tax=Impatiens glandulifera TaxID=253017 RepID=UPI001FB10089|nr:uncharacterized protein LOC124910419 [Impatiens glandulifera]
MEIETPLSNPSKASGAMNGGESYNLSSDAAARKRKRRRCICICLGIVLAILAIAIIILVLSLTYFKAKHPITRVNSINLKDVDFSIDLRLQVHINISIDANLSLKNPNKVGFEYSNSTSYLNYRGIVVGEVPIPAGKILAGKTTDLNLTLTLLADRLLSNSQLYSDVMSSSLPLNLNTRISGKVRILFVKIQVVSNTDCNLNVNVLNKNLTSMDCRYKTKL